MPPAPAGTAGNSAKCCGPGPCARKHPWPRQSWPSPREIAGPLENPFQGFPRPSLDGVGIAQPRLPQAPAAKAGKGRRQRLGVPEKPGLDFLDGDPGEDVEPATWPRVGLGRKACGRRHGFQLFLENPAILKVLIKEDHQAKVTGNPAGIGPEPRGQLVQQIALALERVQLPGRFGREHLGKEVVERGLAEGSSRKKTKCMWPPRFYFFGPPDASKGSPTSKWPSVQSWPSNAPSSMSSWTPRMSAVRRARV